MSGFLWLSDVHIDFVSKANRLRFYERLNKYDRPIIITGDLASGNSIDIIIDEMISSIRNKIYFIPGNHDYYKNSIESVNNLLRSKNIVFLPDNNLIKIDSFKYLVCGVSFCDYHGLIDTKVFNSDINDFIYISELNRTNWYDSLKYYGDIELKRLMESLNKVPDDCSKLLIVNHPILWPVMSKGWRNNLDKYFINKTAGNIISEFADNRPDVDITVLCGHIHQKGSYKYRNVSAYATKAEYNNPRISGLIDEDFKLAWMDLNTVSSP